MKIRIIYIGRYTYYAICVRRPLALLVYTPLSRYIIQQRFGVADSPVHCYRYTYVAICRVGVYLCKLYTYTVRLESNINKKDHCYDDYGGTKHYCFYDNALSRYCQINSTLFNGPHAVFRI